MAQENQIDHGGVQECLVPAANTKTLAAEKENGGGQDPVIAELIRVIEKQRIPERRLIGSDGR